MTYYSGEVWIYGK